MTRQDAGLSIIGNVKSSDDEPYRKHLAQRPQSQFFHLKYRYVASADMTIRTSAIG